MGISTVPNHRGFLEHEVIWVGLQSVWDKDGSQQTLAFSYCPKHHLLTTNFPWVMGSQEVLRTLERWSGGRVGGWVSMSGGGQGARERRPLLSLCSVPSPPRLPLPGGYTGIHKSGTVGDLYVTGPSWTLAVFPLVAMVLLIL